ncbi:hypothetical protein D5272_00070 [bacterium D16-76]|nr:hypothetical protein [bacterium D16-76]
MWGNSDFTVVKTTRITGGLHCPYKGLLLAKPKGSRILFLLHLCPAADFIGGGVQSFSSRRDFSLLGLSVIQNPSGKTPRKLYFAEKNSEPTRHNLMREAIDKALTMSTNDKMFCAVMRKLGYAVDFNPRHK